MAHFAVGFFALGLLVLVAVWPWTARAAADPARALGARSSGAHGRRPRHRHRAHACWAARRCAGRTSTGCGFVKRSWARAHLKDGGELRLARGDVRDPAAADRGQRRPGAQPVRLARQASGLPPLSSTHTAMPPPTPSSSATNEPMNGRRAQPRPASKPVATRADQDDRRDHADQDDLVLVAVGEERTATWLFVGRHGLRQ